MLIKRNSNGLTYVVFLASKPEELAYKINQQDTVVLIGGVSVSVLANGSFYFTQAAYVKSE